MDFNTEVRKLGVAKKGKEASSTTNQSNSCRKPNYSHSISN